MADIKALEAERIANRSVFEAAAEEDEGPADEDVASLAEGGGRVEPAGKESSLFPIESMKVPSLRMVPDLS